MKTCTKCKRELDESEFYKESLGKDGLRSDCKACNKVRVKAWRKHNHQKVRVYNTKTHSKLENKASLRENRRLYAANLPLTLMNEATHSLYVFAEILKAVFGKNSFEVHHIISFDKGGNHEISNLQILDKETHKILHRKETYDNKISKN